MIARRDFLIFLGAVALAEAYPSWAQQSGVRRIGVLLAFFPPDSDAPMAFRQRLRELGYVEGRNLVIEWRYTEGHDDRLADLAAELVRLNMDLIVADVTLAAQAAAHATSTIPIVVTNSADATVGGLVPHLAHPGGNVTGNAIMLAETSVKRMQLLKEAVPKVSRVAVIWNPAVPFHKAMLKEIRAAAPSLGLEPFALAVRSRDDLGNVFSQIASTRANAVFESGGLSPATRQKILDFSARNRLPTMFQSREQVEAGGLMSYAPDFPELLRHAAVYVDKILKGAKPGDLPVEQPTKFELVINLKTAGALGIKIPQSILLRADKVIE